MNIYASLVREIRLEILETRDFQYVPSTSSPRQVDFLPDGQFGAGAKELEKWQIFFDNGLRQTFLRLYSANNQIIATLQLKKDGFWHGRSQQSRGTVLLRPKELKLPKWRLLSNPVAYGKTLIIDETEVDFHYREPLTQQFDWQPYEWNLSESLSTVIPNLPQSDTAVAIIACDRVSYFKQVVQSIARNKNIVDFPVYVFIDQPEEEKNISMMTEQAEIARQYIKHCVIIKRPRNFGCGRNIIDARRQLFDNMGYDKVFILEDDLVISSTYLDYCLKLLSWSKKHFSNVGAVQGWNICRLGLDDKQAMIKTVHSTFTNWWGYLMTKEAWDAMSEEVYRFEDLFLGGVYKHRPHNSVRHWLRLKCKSEPKIVGDTPFPVQEFTKSHQKEYFDDPPTGQDAATMHLFHREGFVRICPTVNRGKYIGAEGIHMNTTWFNRDGFNLIELHEFEEDKIIGSFNLVGEDALPEKPESPLKGFAYIEQ